MRTGLLAISIFLLIGSGGVFAQAPPTGNPAEFSAGPSGWAPAGVGPSVWSEAYAGDGGGSCLWGGVEYLLWWIKKQPIPPSLVLSGDPTTNNPGALNAGGQGVLTGHSVGLGALSGARVFAGGWLDSESTLGIEASGFLLPQRTKAIRAASDATGNPVLGFRYFDTPSAATPLAEDVFQASIPPGNPFGLGPFAGSLAVITQSRLWGAEANAVAGLVSSGCVRLQALGGFRYADLSETVSLNLQSTAVDGAAVTFLGVPFPAPSAIVTSDTFRTRNQFYGGQVGLRGEFALGNLLIGATGKIALGSTHEVIDVQGLSVLTTPGAAPVSVPVGQFAGPSNIGRRTRDEFAVLPEVEFKLAWQLTSWLRASVGYDFWYLSRVARPGKQVDLVVNDSVNPVNGVFGVPPIDQSAFPRPFFERSTFWAQGVTFGLEMRY
jgi:hypothetical protein